MCLSPDGRGLISCRVESVISVSLYQAPHFCERRLGCTICPISLVISRILYSTQLKFSVKTILYFKISCWNIVFLTSVISRCCFNWLKESLKNRRVWIKLFIT